MVPGEVAYVWRGALHATTVAESLVACGFTIRAQIIWAKERLVLSPGATTTGSTSRAGTR
jgi:N6-adenosine-specific RNA methylase IME4